jgi:pheromone shutdown protein TraB
MIEIIGTTHLDSKEYIEKIIKEFNPDVIGVELCEARAIGIFNETTKEIIESKNNNSILNKITNKIKEKAKQQNLDYGSDMKTALSYASNNKLDSILVDMPIQKIQELFMKIPQEEQRGFQKELQEFESQSIQEINEEEVLINLKNRYPIAFEFLINMRNLYITNQILKAKEKYPYKRILIFLGKGHTKQIKKMLE